MSINIISEKEIDGRVNDGINTLLSLTEKDFKDFLNYFKIDEKTSPMQIEFYYTTDPCNYPKEVETIGLEKYSKRRWYYLKKGNIPKMKEIFDNLAKKLHKYSEGSIEKKRISTILNERSIEVLKDIVSKREGFNMEMIDKLFNILIDKDSLEKFLNFENNREFFKINGEYSNIKEYFILLNRIFGIKNKDGTLSKSESISETYYIPQLSIIIENAREIYQRYNIDRYTNPEYEFRNNAPYRNEKIIRKGDEPDWNINPELHKAVYEFMPDDLSLEEKAFYIHTKLCKILECNEEYMYREKGISSKFDSTFLRKNLGNIKPGSKVTCYEFSQIDSKFINEIEGDIEAVVISQGIHGGHFLVGFYTDEISVRLEAINIRPFNKDDTTNDIMKAKSGVKLNGVKVISDKNKIIDKSLERVYMLIYGTKASSLEDYLNELKKLPKLEETNNLKSKIESFTKVMIDKGIRGNEFVQSFEKMRKLGLFGIHTEKAYIGKKEIEDGEVHIQRMILLRNIEHNKNNRIERLFLIKTSSLEIIETTSQMIIDGLNSDELVYEDKEHILKGIVKDG